MRIKELRDEVHSNNCIIGGDADPGGLALGRTGAGAPSRRRSPPRARPSHAGGGAGPPGDTARNGLGASRMAHRIPPGPRGNAPLLALGGTGLLACRFSLPFLGFSCRYATNRMAFRFHKKTRLVSSSAPLARSCADLSTDLAAFPICREVRLAWSRTAARRCFPRAGSKKNIKPPPKPIPASPTIRPVLPCIESSPFNSFHLDPVTIAYRAGQQWCNVQFAFQSANPSRPGTPRTGYGHRIAWRKTRNETSRPAESPALTWAACHGRKRGHGWKLLPDAGRIAGTNPPV